MIYGNYFLDSYSYRVLNLINGGVNNPIDANPSSIGSEKSVRQSSGKKCDQQKIPEDTATKKSTDFKKVQ